MSDLEVDGLMCSSCDLALVRPATIDHPDPTVTYAFCRKCATSSRTATAEAEAEIDRLKRQSLSWQEAYQQSEVVAGEHLARAIAAEKLADKRDKVLDEVNERLAVLEPKVGSLVDELAQRRAETVRLHGALNCYPHAYTCDMTVEPTEREHPCSCWRSELAEIEEVLDDGDVPPREIPDSPAAAVAGLALPLEPFRVCRECSQVAGHEVQHVEGEHPERYRPPGGIRG